LMEEIPARTLDVVSRQLEVGAVAHRRRRERRVDPVWCQRLNPSHTMGTPIQTRVPRCPMQYKPILI
jgi:hypothetical protein